MQGMMTAKTVNSVLGGTSPPTDLLCAVGRKTYGGLSRAGRRSAPAGRILSSEKESSPLKGRPLSLRPLYVEIEKKLVGVRSELDGIDFVCGLVADPHVNDVRGKHIPLQQKIMVVFQGR